MRWLDEKNPNMIEGISDGYIRVGQFIRNRRKELGYKVEDLVERLEKQGIVTSISSIQRLENGESMRLNLGDAEFVNALARALRVSTSEILELSGHIQRSAIDSDLRRLTEIGSELTPENLEIAVDIISLLAEKQAKSAKG